MHIYKTWGNGLRENNLVLETPIDVAAQQKIEKKTNNNNNNNKPNTCKIPF